MCSICTNFRSVGFLFCSKHMNFSRKSIFYLFCFGVRNILPKDIRMLIAKQYFGDKFKKMCKEPKQLEKPEWYLEIIK